MSFFLPFQGLHECNIKPSLTTMCFKIIAFENLDIPTIQGKTSRNFPALEVYQNK
jgi:hypothetical protein